MTGSCQEALGKTTRQINATVAANLGCDPARAWFSRGRWRTTRTWTQLKPLFECGNQARRENVPAPVNGDPSPRLPGSAMTGQACAQSTMVMLVASPPPYSSTFNRYAPEWFPT